MFIRFLTEGGYKENWELETEKQLDYCGEYNIPDDCIVDTIVDFLLEKFPFMERSVFENAIEKQEHIVFPIKQFNEKLGVWVDCEFDDNGYCLENKYAKAAEFFGGSYTLYETYCWGEYTYLSQFQFQEIPNDQISYLVIETSLTSEDCPELYERLCVAPFRDLDAAKEYLATMERRGVKPYTEDVEYVIFVENTSHLSKDKWFIHNMEVISLMNEKGVNICHSSYSKNVQWHIDNLKKL